MDELSRIFRNSEKAELIEALSGELAASDAPKVIVICINDKDDGKYSSVVYTLGLNTTYEAYGILEVAKQDLQEDDFKKGK